MSSAPSWIETPFDPQLDALCQQLERSSGTLVDETCWPEEQLRLCAEFGVFRWFIPEPWGGCGWSPEDVVRGYLRLSAACLTTTFVITQYTGACRRIAASDSGRLQDELLPRLSLGQTFATLGISHLTTSRLHLRKPMLAATPTTDGWLLSGTAPWITGGPASDHLVLGASTEDGQQLLACVPTDAPGVTIAPPARLVGLSASQTGPVHFDEVAVSHELILAGPVENVMQQGAGARTGGVQTSTLATGLARAAVRFLAAEAIQRPNLEEASRALAHEVDTLEADVIRVAAGDTVCTNEELRTRANSLVLRATQAALSAAKGTGYVVGHPAGRWCQEALFFLVWSCPQPVVHANLCELAGIAGE